MGDAAQIGTSPALYCANHPDRETLLRCSKCGKPICPQCGIRTPVGIRCRTCARLQRPPSYVVKPWHYLLAAVLALPASFLAGLVMEYVGFFFAFFLGGAVGGLIREAVYRVTGGQRGRALAFMVCGCIILGALAVGGWGTLTVGRLPIANLVYVFLAVGAAYARLN